jgi:hypothetical protein
MMVIASGSTNFRIEAEKAVVLEAPEEVAVGTDSSLPFGLSEDPILLVYMFYFIAVLYLYFESLSFSEKGYGMKERITLSNFRFLRRTMIWNIDEVKEGTGKQDQTLDSRDGKVNFGAFKIRFFVCKQYLIMVG